MLNERRANLLTTLSALMDSAFEDAIATLVDASVSEDERREKVRAFMAAGDDMIAVGSGGEIH